MRLGAQKFGFNVAIPVGELEVPEVAASAGDLPTGARSVATAVPGSVWKLLVAKRDTVAQGDALRVIESMKMEFTVSAPCAGRVLRMACREGSTVAEDQDIVLIH